ncbi:Abi family protein (plasmid) [Rhodococcus pyridinivorans]|uniref:Abi family protein n=1 Tax=Rhodococcus pyridinivorans TaxID=103816 RepID=UPI0020C63731|nr:Abi family protein [Rhodococcus pyridinivorans]UTM39710.1 Abi family protein [Rhodococcus pyridinivorans]
MKPFLTVEQQVQKLRDNGLDLAGADLALAQQLLYDHNYYRLSGYFRYFQINPAAGNNRFDVSATFADIRAAYLFDQQLARKLHEGLAEFEVVFRSQLAYLMGQSTGPDGYLDETAYEYRNGARDTLFKSIQEDLGRSTERFSKHHETRGEPMPIWAAVEVMSLGTTSKMYGLTTDVEGVLKPLATKFDLKHSHAARTFRAMTVLRNVCAHHGRIWNRSHGVELEAPRKVQTDRDKSIYKNTPWAWIMTLAHLVDAIRNTHDYSDALWDFIEAQPAWLCDGLTHPSPK